MPDNLPHDWEMPPRFRILDSAVQCSHGDRRWQLYRIKQPSWSYSFLWMRPLDFGADAGFIGHAQIFGARETLQTVGKQIDSIIGRDALARRFVLNTRGQLRRDNQRAHDLTVTRDGVAAWNSRKNHDETPFRWRGNPLSGAE